LSVLRELVEEGARGVDRELVGEREQVLVAADEDGALCLGQGQLRVGERSLVLAEQRL
jgi:hypothetical protein